jgi:hypothetical protein
MMEALSTSESSDLTRATRRNIPENGILNSKDVPVTDREIPQGCEMYRLPHFLENRFTGGGEAA